jgi:hypothetical protein
MAGILKVHNRKPWLFIRLMQLYPINLTKLRDSHNSVNFSAYPNIQNIILKPDRILVIKGIMVIRANNNI